MFARALRATLTAIFIVGTGAAAVHYASVPREGGRGGEAGFSGRGGGAGGGGSGGRGGLRGGGEEGPVPILAATAQTADVPIFLSGVGTTRALKTVTVRPQVDGKLVTIAFREGQDVKRGDVLARIDPTTYQALYDQALAKKAQDEAQLANARLTLERAVRLLATNSGTAAQVDTQRAQVAQLEAQVNADQAAIDNAKAVLDYTTITAPIDGRTGLRLVDEGNIVRGGDSTGIVVITQIRPVSVFFNLPQQDLARVNAAFARGTLPAEALESDGTTVLDRGRLQVIDNQVDPATGTVRLKAEFPNADLRLWPGQFVSIRLLVDTLRGVTVVPTAAVQRGPSGTFVYALQPDDTVAVRPVEVTRQDDAQAVIAGGVAPGERVVTTGFARLKDGARIRVAPGPAGAPAPAPVPSAEGAPPRREGAGEGREERRRPDGGPPGRAGVEARPSAGAATAAGGPPAGGPP